MSEQKDKNYTYIVECSDGTLYTGWTKNSGLLYTFKSAAHKKKIVTVMILYIALCVAMLCFTGVYGLGTICAAVISFLWYRHVAYSKFGGITGDIAGYFVCICEVLCVIFGGVLCVLL